MSSDRREFLRHATVVAAGLGVPAFPLTAQPRSSAMPTARASALMAAFGLKYPIFCAGMGGVAFPELAIARSQRDASRGERDMMQMELQGTQATLQNQIEQTAFHARRSASFEAKCERIEAECERIKGSRWWRLAERMRAFERRFRFRRQDRR